MKMNQAIFQIKNFSDQKRICELQYQQQNCIRISNGKLKNNGMIFTIGFDEDSSEYRISGVTLRGTTQNVICTGYTAGLNVWMENIFYVTENKSDTANCGK